MAVEVDVGFDVPPVAMRQVVAMLKEHSEGKVDLTADEILRATPRNHILAALAQANRIPFWATFGPYVDKEFLHDFDVSIMRRGQMVPIRRSANRITIAIANPYNTIGPDYCRQEFASHELVVLMAPFTEIENLLSQTTEQVEISEEALTRAKEDIGEIDEVSKFDISKKIESVIPELLRGIFAEALRIGATDIHLATEDRRFYYKFRVHGDLGEEKPIDWEFRNMLDAVLLDLVGFARDKAPRIVKVDGRFTIITHESGKKVECRYNRHLSYHGYHITIRLLDKSGVEPKLGAETLQFDEATMRWIRWALEMADGITIMSGPTGSGKSTTLNAFLREVWRPRYNMMTLENPVEWEVPGVIHCNMRKASEFREYLEAFMRADPDIILVGEIRDTASADLALEASRTGHQVFTTLHANSAVDILDRLQDFDVTRADIGRQVRLLCAQRLVKTICPVCSGAEKITPQMMQTFGLPERMTDKEIKKRNDKGCGKCFHGVTGRKAVIEILPIDREVSTLIVKGEVPLTELEKQVREKYELKSLSEYAVEMIERGETDIEGAKDVINLAW